MRKLELMAIALALAVVVVLFYASPIFASGNGRMNCGDWARTRVGEYLLENNVWGDKAADICSFAGDGFVGWFWSKDFPTGKPIYPEIIYGKKPWLEKSTTDKLPAKIKELPVLAIEVDYATIARGKYNVLIDVWITRDKEAGVKSIAAEVGIYLRPHEPLRDCELVEVDGHGYCYEVAGSGAGCRLYRFVFAGDEPPSRLNVMRFIRFAGLDGDLYVASVEFGNEVWFGNGVTIIKNITVEAIDP